MSDSTEKISVVGFGLMGAQISQVLAVGGYEVMAYDIDESILSKGLELIKSGKYGLENSVKNGRISYEDSSKAFSRISTTTSLEKAVDHAQIVLEAAVEDLAVKQKIFRDTARLTEPDAILATNTSTISIRQIGQILRMRDRARLVGMHFFNPPQVMKLVEVIKTKSTRPEAISKIEQIAKRLRKVPVVVLDFPGFIANRIGITVFSEASLLLEKGVANIRDIDLSMRLGYGYPLGPFELGDLVGLDARLRNMEALFEETGEEKFRPPKTLRKLVAQGYLGDPKLKPDSRGGYYEYFGLKRPSESE